MSPLFILLLLLAEAWSFTAPRDKPNVFARKACPAILIFFNAAYQAGATVELPCHCKPEEVQSVVWFFREHHSYGEATRALSDNNGTKLLDSTQITHSSDLRSRFSIRLFSLLIFRTAVEDSGIYICGSAQGDYFYAYDLDIQEVQELSFVSRLTPENKSNSVEEVRGKRSGLLLYQIFTTFQPWSQCDRCGVQGEQVRVGLCYIRSRYLHVRFKRLNQSIASCGSGAVPQAFGQLKHRGARLEFRDCNVSCPIEAPPTSKVGKKTGLKIGQWIQHSSSDAMKEPAIKVSYLNHPAEQILTLGCPGAQTYMAIAWDKGSEPIYRSQTTTEGTFPRIRIDAGHHLVFTPAQIEDSGVFYCWLKGRRVAEINLLVYPHFGARMPVTSNPDLPSALRIILKSYGAMTAVFCLVITLRGCIRYRRGKTIRKRNMALREAAPERVEEVEEVADEPGAFVSTVNLSNSCKKAYDQATVMISALENRMKELDAELSHFKESLGLTLTRPPFSIEMNTDEEKAVADVDVFQK
ncbi:Ig-like V-type domain-containing protein FAM187A isoform 1-T1 [Syngnathus typhle]